MEESRGRERERVRGSGGGDGTTFYAEVMRASSTPDTQFGPEGRRVGRECQLRIGESENIKL